MYMVILKIVTLAIEIGPAMKQSSKVELLSKIFKDVVWIDMDAHIYGNFLLSIYLMVGFLGQHPTSLSKCETCVGSIQEAVRNFIMCL